MGPLQGVKVIELASLAPAPFGCMVLADLGADVLRIDRKSRHREGLVPPQGPLDRGKHSLTLDLKNPGDRDTLLSLVEKADVFIEGFRPGVTERLGIGPEDLHQRNSRLVYGRMTGWGQHGALSATAGHDINYIAMAGVLDLIGRPGEAPAPPANIIGDFAGGGMLLAVGVIAAIYERERSGVGQVIDVAMVDGAALYTAFMHGMHAAGMWNEPRGQNTLDGYAPFYDTYECADGKYVAVGCVELPFYEQMLAVLGIEDPDLPFQLDRNAWPHIKMIIAAKFKERSRDAWAQVFAATDACVTPVLSPWEAHKHPHNAERDAYIDVAGLRQPAPAPRFSRTRLEVPSPCVTEAEPVAEMLAQWSVDAG